MLSWLWGASAAAACFRLWDPHLYVRFVVYLLLRHPNLCFVVRTVFVCTFSFGRDPVVALRAFRCSSFAVARVCGSFDELDMCF